MKILIIAEHDNQKLKEVNFHTLTAALELGTEIDLLIVGFQCQTVVEQAKKIPGIQQILLADDVAFTDGIAENVVQPILAQAKNYQYVLMAATTYGKNILPRAAALLDMSMITDVIKIENANTFVRPIYAGNAFATLQSEESIKLLTIRSTAFSAAEKVEMREIPLTILPTFIPDQRVQFVSHELTKSVRPELTSAKIVISGGRGLKNAENFKLLEELADSLGAALGASRAAVDAGFAPNDYQVGQTGKVVAPDLYIAIGISGAIQHLAGMKDSKVIVAINSDPEAPIFEIADYSLVADLFEVLPELQKELQQNITH